MKKVAFYTLGCKVNQYETDSMRAIFEKDGFIIVDFNECADIYVINTCTVTAMGDKKSRQIIHYIVGFCFFSGILILKPSGVNKKMLLSTR